MDNTQFFSGMRPNLINEKALKTINKILDNSEIPPPTTGEHLFKLYDEYIKPNVFGILIIVIISLFLFIRYVIKKYNDSDAQIDAEIENVDENVNKENNKNKENKEKRNVSSDDDQFTLSTDNSDDNNGDEPKEERELGLEELNEEYNKAVRENASQMSEQMIKEIYKKKKDKFSFDELTRMLVDGGNAN